MAVCGFGSPSLRWSDSLALLSNPLQEVRDQLGALLGGQGSECLPFEGFHISTTPCDAPVKVED